MISNNSLLLIGGGGHCRSCVDVIREEGKWHLAGVVEADGVKEPQPCMGVEVIGFDRDLHELLKRTPYCLITVGQVKNADLRAAIFQRLVQLGAAFPVIISPHGYVSPSASVGQGTIVMHQALVNAQAQIGRNVIINSQALVEHDAVIGDHCHISTGAKINGGVQIGSGCLVGSGAIVKQGVTLADNVIIGAGSLVLTDIDQAGIYTGVIK